jgi:uncharacterized RDD family membrane protein YckC
VQWYYAKGDEKFGPVTESELSDWASKGDITPDTLVWNETMTDWVRFAEVSESVSPSNDAESQSREAKTSCSMCGKMFAESDLIAFENLKVCASCKPIFLQQIRENAEVSGINIMRYAGFGTRFGAKFIDGLIIFAAIVPISILFQFASAAFEHPIIPLLLMLLLQAIQLVVPALYTILMHGKYGATVGKKAMKIHVVMSDGRPISYGRATGRYFAELLSRIILCIGYIMAAFDDEKRALHDHMCNTRVVYKDEA